ncbi:MAG: hypothetical protein HY890_06245 [Deltaproteobacteria bacterium]|nr:hypothetical protein [Deltaproteobacteria bacterium]
MAEQGIYSIFAAMLEYPREDMRGMTRECIKALEGHPHSPPAAVSDVKAFLKEISEMPLDDLQGLYSYTFEMGGGEHTLDLGYHLFDGFKRSGNLVTIKTMYRETAFPFEAVSRGELPDHLPVVLRFLDFIKEKEPDIRKSFREDFVIKALEKLNKNFELKQDTRTPYRHLVRAITLVVDKDIKTEDLETKQGFGA